ncbi:MAG: hypothetical protein J6M12_02720 [Clostridia bacterium]|nr:hypothetical protein [Clostridia bacterium]
MKRILAILLVILFSLTLFASCNKKQESTSPSSPSSLPSSSAPSPAPELSTSLPQGTSPEDVEAEPVKIPFGLYKITSSDGKVLGYDNTNTPGYEETDYKRTCWTVESFLDAKGRRGYTLYAGDLPSFALTAQKALPGGTTKVFQSSAVNPEKKQLFYLEEYEDGTFALKSAVNPIFALAATDETPSLALFAEAGEEIKWKFEPLTEGCDRYVEWRSVNGLFTVRMGPDILRRARISSERMQEWANQMENVYYSYVELTGFVPYQHIIFKAYEGEEYPGYVMGNYMVISADKDFMYTDLGKMAQRDTMGVTDYNFLLLHEMGHMFDWGRQWDFEGEAMTDIKVSYALYDNPEAVAAPSEFGAKEYFNGQNINECYNECAGNKPMNGTYNIFRTAAIFTEFGQMDNWETMKKTYHWFEESGWKAQNNTEMLEKYVEKLSEFSGKDIRSMIADKEWETIVAKTQG